MIIFQPGKRRERYSKKYIHADEEPFFIGEQNSSIHLGQYHNIALAICYEISNDEHVLAAYESGSGFYFASVAKFVDGIDKAHERLAEIARTYSMTVMLSNCVGTADGAVCGGRSAVWNKQGALLGQLDDINQGLLIFDTVTQECRAYPVR
jgi:predicted amidohydrolase